MLRSKHTFPFFIHATFPSQSLLNLENHSINGSRIQHLLNYETNLPWTPDTVPCALFPTTQRCNLAMLMCLFTTKEDLISQSPPILPKLPSLISSMILQSSFCSRLWPLHLYLTLMCTSDTLRYSTIRQGRLEEQFRSLLPPNYFSPSSFVLPWHFAYSRQVKHISAPHTKRFT